QLGFDGPVTAVTNDGDPISFTGGNYFGAHGVDPTAPTFGAQPFPTRPKGTHSSYWTDPVFLEGLRTITQRSNLIRTDLLASQSRRPACSLLPGSETSSSGGSHGQVPTPCSRRMRSELGRRGSG